MLSFFFSPVSASMGLSRTDNQSLAQRLNEQLTHMQEFLQGNSNALCVEMKKTCDAMCLELKQANQKDEKALTIFHEKVATFRNTHLTTFLRLHPAELNALNSVGGISDAKEAKDAKLTVPTVLKVDAEQRNDLRYRKVAKSGKEFYVFAVTQDIKQDSQSILTYVGGAIKKFKQLHHDSKATLLFPVAQCSTVLEHWAIPRVVMGMVNMFVSIDPYVKKQHFVLLEVSLEHMSLNVHNSGQAWKEKYFPETFIDIAADCSLAYDAAKNLHSYEAQQVENVLCAQYVAEYCRSITETGGAALLAKIKLDEAKYTTSIQYMRQYLPSWGSQPQLTQVEAAPDCDWVDEEDCKQTIKKSK